ncbi:MAG: cytochrome C [Chloroflexi bacterium]|nr:cytochrome C [Chloroflexota bacterium]
MTGLWDKLIGPRLPAEQTAEQQLRYLLPTVFLGLAAFCLLVSIFVPYWRLKLLAPQYPDGLEVQVYVNRMTGDVKEIDGLNHYIGMRPLEEAAQLERSLSIFAIAVISLLVIAAIYVHNQWAALLSLPALLFPAIFLGDLYFWLRHFGQNLDPSAPLSNAIEPFVPPVLGEGKIGQFQTIASVDRGFYLAALASFLILLGLYFHRRAYKPLVEATERSPTEG